MQTAAHLHLCDETAWNDVKSYVATLLAETDLYITYPADSAEALNIILQAECPTAQTFPLGSEAGAFPLLMLCKLARLEKYAAILTITHDPHQTSASELALALLAGSRTTLQVVKSLYSKQPGTGLVGVAATARQARPFMNGSRPFLQELLDQLKINPENWPFFVSSAFWLPGPVLRYLVDHADLLSESIPDTTPLDHLPVMLPAALSHALGLEPYVLEHSNHDGNEILLMLLREHGPCNDLRMQIAPPSWVTDRITVANELCKKLSKSKLFEKDYYSENLESLRVPGMAPLYHYVLYGDLLGLNPGPGFCTNFYLITRQDVADLNICSLDHYQRVGIRNGVPATPSAEDWLDLAETVGLFSTEWYTKEYPDVATCGLSSKEHFLQIGRFLGRATHPDFDPQAIPALNYPSQFHKGDVIEYLEVHYRWERAVYVALQRAYENGDPHLLEALGFRLKHSLGETEPLYALWGISHVLNFKWEDAKLIWRDFWAKKQTNALVDRHRIPLARLSHQPVLPSPDLQVAQPQWPRETKMQTAKVCIYTTLFGDIDDLLPILFPEDGIDYICFTDRQRSTPGWEQIIVDPGLETPNLCAKIFKILPHHYLREYDFSMFVDANTLFLGRIREFVDFCLANGDFLMWHHPYRSDLYLESCAIIAHGRHEPDPIIAQIKHYSEQGIERNTGLFEASFMWRRHGAASVRTLMEDWWQEIMTHSSRDQISLGYLTWRGPTRPMIMPSEIGTSRDNLYFSKIPHKPQAPKGAELSAPLVTANPRDIAFLYSPRFRETGSTILRGQQLSALATEEYEGSRAVIYTDSTELTNKIVILTKGFLKTVSAQTLRDLRRSNTLIADFVDEPPIPDLVEEVDGLIASSLVGYRSYLLKYPLVPSFHVTHHVDTRIPEHWRIPKSKFHTGYFGEMSNTISDDHIASIVNFNQVDTSRQTLDWMDHIGRFSFHYAVRKTREIDGAKPFLKGFVAAHCGANMLIQNSAGDASYYLGKDYPYLLQKEATQAEIMEMLLFARESFLGPEWQRGMEIMREIREKSSREHVLKEFSNMIRNY